MIKDFRKNHKSKVKKYKYLKPVFELLNPETFYNWNI